MLCRQTSFGNCLRQTCAGNAAGICKRCCSDVLSWKIDLYHRAKRHVKIIQDQKQKRGSFARMSATYTIHHNSMSQLEWIAISLALTCWKCRCVRHSLCAEPQVWAPSLYSLNVFSPIPQLCGLMISARCIGQAGGHYGWRVMVCIKDAKRRTSQIMHLVGTCWSSYAGVGCCNTVSTIFLWWNDRMPTFFRSVCSFPSYTRQHEICSRRPVRMFQRVTVFSWPKIDEGVVLVRIIPSLFGIHQKLPHLWTKDPRFRDPYF